jgi:hypothetical protein
VSLPYIKLLKFQTLKTLAPLLDFDYVDSFVLEDETSIKVGKVVEYITHLIFHEIRNEDSIHKLQLLRIGFYTRKLVRST